MGVITLNNNKQQFSKELHDDEYQLERIFAKKPTQLTSKLIAMGAQMSDWYPMMLLTEGQKKVKYIEGKEYNYPVIDSTRRGAINILKSDYAGSDKPGLNGAEFDLLVDDVLIVNYLYVIKGGMELYCRAAVQVEDAWKGSFVIMDSQDNGQYVPVASVAEGRRLSQGAAVVSYAASRGNGSMYSTPYSKKNQMNMFRKTYKTEGEVVKEVISFDYKSNPQDGNARKMWMDWRKWQWRQEWAMEKEIGLWYGRYNKRPDGVIPVKDPKSGLPAQRGSGIFEQVYNKRSYSFLSAQYLEDLTLDLFQGTAGQTKKELTLMTGELGKTFFDRAMKQLMGDSRFTLSSDKIITGTPGNLEYNYGFTSYVTPQGHRIVVKTHPMFDEGPGADVEDVVKGRLTTESARMIFLDSTNYNGEDNIQMVIEKGWDEIVQRVSGVGSDTNGVMNAQVATDLHASSEEHMTRRGIEILRATNCLDLRFKQL